MMFITRHQSHNSSTKARCHTFFLSHKILPSYRRFESSKDINCTQLNTDKRFISPEQGAKYCIYVVNNIAGGVDLIPSQLTRDLSYSHNFTSVYFK